MSDRYRVYQWVNGEGIERDVPDSWYLLKAQGLTEHLTVDPNHTDPKYRYGQYHGADESWRHIPLEDFPKEFRMHLLLLGAA